MSYRFHHVHIICKDLERMIGFFTEVLAARLIDRRKFGTADGASLNLDGATINLRMAREDEQMVGDASQSAYGFDHIMPPTEIPHMKIAFFKGHEGITIELCQPRS